MYNHPAISVDTSTIRKVELVLWFSGRVGRIIAVVCPYGNHIIFSIFDVFGDISNDRQESAEVLVDQRPVNPYLGFPHDGFKVQEKLFPFPGNLRCKMFPVPYFSLIVDASTGFCRNIFYAVGQGNKIPFFVVESGLFGSFQTSFVHTPGRIHTIHRSSRVGKFEKTGSRIFRLVSKTLLCDACHQAAKNEINVGD